MTGKVLKKIFFFFFDLNQLFEKLVVLNVF